mgnify:CR=1 FL=1
MRVKDFKKVYRCSFDISVPGLGTTTSENKDLDNRIIEQVDYDMYDGIIVYLEEKQADKMFEELGFEKTVWGSEETLSIRYESKDKGTIVFDPLNKVFYGIEDFESKDITVEEHLAIHEKMKELGWFD